MPYARINPRQKFPGRRVVLSTVEAESIEVIHGAIRIVGDFPPIESALAFKKVTAGEAEALARQPYFATSAIGPENPAVVQIVETEEEARAIETNDREAIMRASSGRSTLVVHDGT